VVVSPPDFTAYALLARQQGETRRETTASKAEEKAAPAAHARPALASEYVAPGNPTEEIIAALWKTLLGIDKVGVHDNFFELGGHSLLATQLVARLRDQFQTDITMAKIFERPTVASLSELLAGPGQETPEDELAQVGDRGRKRAERRQARRSRGVDED
jgi:acyl carrier protein